MLKLYGIQIAYGFSPEARVFAHLLGRRSDQLDARVLMHDEAHKSEPSRRFEETAKCDVVRMDTGWRENTTGSGRSLLAKLSMGARYTSRLPAIVSDARAYSPDIIYSCQQHFDIVAASRVADSLKKPQVIHLHYIVGPWLRKQALERLQTCDHVITVSDFIREEALRHGVAPEKVTTVRNAMSPMPPVSTEECVAARAEIGVPESAFLFGIVSRLDLGKGHADTIDAFSKVAELSPDVWLAIVGSGTLEDELKTRAQSSPARDRIVFTGRRSDVPRLLGSMNAFVHPSREDPCPLAVLEALASGLPVVAYAEGGAKEMIVSSETGYLASPGNIDELASAMAALQHDRALAHALGEAARERISVEFRPEDASRKFEEVLRKVV